MPQLYARVFLQILDSSLADDWQTRHVFEDLLKLSNMDGVVDMTREAISRRTNTPQAVVDRALNMLEAPDPRSRDPEEGGRRIIRLDDHRDWGWRIVNFQKYDVIRATKEMREWNSLRMARYRSHKKSPPSPPKESEVPPSPPPDHSTKCADCSTTRSTTRSVIELVKAKLNEYFHREKNVAWSYADESALVEISKRTDVLKELQEILAYAPKANGYFPQSVSSLLDGWDRHLDKARNRQSPKMTVHELEVVAKTLTDQINRHPGNPKSDSFDKSDPNHPKQKSDYHSLCARLNTVRNQITSYVPA